MRVIIPGTNSQRLLTWQSTRSHTMIPFDPYSNLESKFKLAVRSPFKFIISSLIRLSRRDDC